MVKQKVMTTSFYNNIQTEIMDFFTKLTSTDSSYDTWKQCVYKYGFNSIVLVIVSIILFNIFSNTGDAHYNIQKYFFLYAFPILFMFALILNLGKDRPTTNLFIKTTGVLAFCAIAIYYMTYNGANISVYSNKLLIGFIILIGLGIVYQYVVNYMSRMKGWAGFISQLIFYIPCVLWDLWVYILDQFHLTPYSVYGFICLEVVLVILYLYLPDIAAPITGTSNSIQLANNVIYLDKGKQTIATSDMLKIPPAPNQTVGSYLTNYCLSMWVYINPHSPTSEAYNKETEIMSYGFTDASGVQHVKPMLRYYGGGVNDQPIERNKYVFYFAEYPPATQSPDTFYDVTIPNQKWNQIVMNYTNNRVDIFINGVLERSFNMTNSMPVYNDLDTITVGDDNGLDGGICNVVYYRHPLSEDQIAFLYNSQMNSDPPISSKNLNTD
jgi:hypothetical protein